MRDYFRKINKPVVMMMMMMQRRHDDQEEDDDITNMFMASINFYLLRVLCQCVH